MYYNEPEDRHDRAMVKSFWWTCGVLAASIGLMYFLEWLLL